MKKTTAALLFILMLIPVSMFADGYAELWKKVKEAAEKDLPKTQISLLKAISDKSASERNYGQMLTAEWQTVWVWGSISPDSLLPQIDALRIKAETLGQTDAALSAVCYAALGKACADWRLRKYGVDSLVAECRKKAMANPALLAAERADAYAPFTVAGRDAHLFGNDLLSLIGYTAEDYATMHAYYSAAGNRTAALLTALDLLKQRCQESGELYAYRKSSKYLAGLDSLINAYSDLPACCEVAIDKYAFIYSCRDFSAKEKADFISHALDRWGGWQRADELRNSLKRLTCPMFEVDFVQNTVLPDKRIALPVKVRNIDKLTLTLVRLAADGTEKRSPDNRNNLKALKALAVKGTERTYAKSFPYLPDYDTAEDSIVIGGLPVGVYLVEAAVDNKNVDSDRCLLYVTDMFVLSQELPRKQVSLAVVSGATGQPVAGAKLALRLNGGKTVTLTCGADGETVYRYAASADRIIQARAYTADDNAAPFASCYNSFSYSGNTTKRNSVSLFTDRKIYRPGQTVHVAAVCRKIDNLEQTAAEGLKVKLTLRDANYKNVAEKTVIADAYGAAHADFVLPSGGLGGTFTIRTESSFGGVAVFSVEEYKRPTFNVEFDDVAVKYENGDTVTVIGRAKAYSGVAVQGAKVKYTVRRKQALWWRFGGMYEPDNSILAQGEAVTDGDGTFRIDMPMVLPVWEDGGGVSRNEYYRMTRFYNITAEADVTDAAGETHGGEISLPLGSRSVAFGCDLPEKTLRDSLKTLTFTLKNSAGNNIDGDVTYTVSGVVGTFTAKANVPVEAGWNTADALKSGRHTLTAVCSGDTIRQDFVVFSYDDTAPCIDTPDWMYVSADEFPRDGSPVYVQFGSSDTEVHVLYTVIAGDKVIKNGTLELNGELITRSLTYKDEYGQGLRINMVWVKDGKAYAHSLGIKKPLPDKRLTLKWTTFRDRLTPGGKEEWTLNVTTPDGKPADAQLLATMYDASLDQLASLSWKFASLMTQNLPYARWRTLGYYSELMRSAMTLKLANVTPLDFGHIATGQAYSGKGDVLISSEELSMVRSAVPTSQKQSAMSNMKVTGAAEPAYAADMQQAEVVAEDAMGTDGGEGAETGAETVQLRENLNETAFFYPALQTDADGNISVKFTLPESVTTWRFMGFAHDKAMNNGRIEAWAVASKKVMVQPNMPRFVRKGDRATITSRIYNTSGNAVAGTAVMQMTDPETEKIVAEEKRVFEIAADSTAVVSFEFSPKAGSQLLVCKIFAEGDGFSDGEQHYLPVLADEELVTTTVPFTQNGAGTKTIDLERLFAGDGGNGKLTVEYTNNPAWLMIQTLPYIDNVSEDNAIGLAAAYYANSISAYLMKQSPRIKTVFEQWKREEGQESMTGSLEKNQELKNIVIDETPWVADADNESDQKRMLANYFDESTLANGLASTLDKLRKLQSASDGSWSWWPGMNYGSPALTATITEMLLRLDNMTGKHAETSGMIDKAVKFISGIVVKEVEKCRQDEKEGKAYYINEDNALRYLYICAIGERRLSDKEREAADFVLDYLKKKTASLDLYHKALMAVVLADRGERQLAGEYIKSLEEYSVSTAGMGRYYDSPRTRYSWFDYGIPTQVAAIEAMTLVDGAAYANTIDEMKTWLLQQKRVQGWNTPINSVNAVYASLIGNADMLGNKEQAVLAIDGKRLDTSPATAGLGYVKTAATPGKAKTFTATKTSDGTSWGAVYAQSVQKTSSITSASAGFTVTRELVTPDGRPASDLKVGDKVTVKITIKADRDYDYVQVKDKRAACMEPVIQLSGYRNGCYSVTKDNAVNYYFDRMGKGVHSIETEYYIDRAGTYETGTCSVQCAYSPEYTARTASKVLNVSEKP